MRLILWTLMNLCNILCKMIRDTINICRSSVILHLSEKKITNNKNLNFVRGQTPNASKKIRALMGDFSQAREIDSTAIKRYSEQAAHANRGYNVLFCASRAIPLARQAMMYHLQKKRFWKICLSKIILFPD